MRADSGAGGLAAAGGSGSSINSDWITVEAEVAAVAAAGEKNSGEDDVPNTVDYNGEVGCMRIESVRGSLWLFRGTACLGF